MPWYIRKALTRGPIRLNLSKSGLGASFGVKGLRIGVGPKGTYVHGGRGGLYYRQYLNSGHRPGQPRPVPALLPETSAAEEVERVALPAADDEVAAEINDRLRAFRWSRLTFASALIAGIWLVAVNLPAIAGVVFGSLVGVGIYLSSREASHRRIVFTYELRDEFATLQENCIGAFQDASKCIAIWRVVTQSSSRDTKYTAGAGSIVERKPTRITFNDPIIRTNAQTVWISAAGGKLCLLPDRMLFFGPNGVSSLKYPEVHTEAMNINFREDGRVPSDSTNVGLTWQYVNKNGGPDRRFASNRQLPILQYSDFLFEHPTLSFRLEFSRAGTADLLVRAMQTFSQASLKLASASE